MLKTHEDIIIRNMSTLVEHTDLNNLIPELLKRGVFNESMLTRILNPASDKAKKTNLFTEILNRGPKAYSELVGALNSTNHSNLVELLRRMETENEAQLQRSGSSDFVSSSGSPYSTDVCEGPSLSTTAKTSTGNGAVGVKLINFSSHREKSGSSNASDTSDFHPIYVNDPNEKVFAHPIYKMENLNLNVRRNYEFGPGIKISYANQKFLPVYVVHAKEWIIQGSGQPQMYKMESNPRGYALIVSNKNFWDKENFPDRVGADNDEVRLCQLLNQLYFQVEMHKDKTKDEMEIIVRDFSQKQELEEADCIWVTFMSHGQEGDSIEDSEVVGIDGIGYKTESIVSMFYNNACKAMAKKPKIFTFQACRGDLTDSGVFLQDNIRNRITTDGKRIPPKTMKERTQSDIFIAYPTAPGKTANRDQLTGAWFIQAIVDVFSEHACHCHLDDLFKLVDEQIKDTNNLILDNFQSVTTKSVGWFKNLYFNPGLYRDKVTGKTVRFDSLNYAPQTPGEGMDVVDSSSSDKTPNGTSSHWGPKDKKDDDSDNEDKKIDCFNFAACRTS